MTDHIVNNSNENIDINELNVILERIVTFISNCDTKVSFLLSSLGVVMTILFTLKPIKFDLIKSIVTKNDFLKGWDFWLLIVLIISLIICIVGIYLLLDVLKARVKCENYSHSVIFFGHIANFNCHLTYLNQLKTTNLTKYQDDLAFQIFINSKICDRKYKLFNIGLKLSTYPLPLLFFCWSYLF